MSYSSRSTVATPLQPHSETSKCTFVTWTIIQILCKISYFRGFEISTQNVNFWRRFSGSGPMLHKQFQGCLEACLDVIKGPHKLNNNEAHANPISDLNVLTMVLFTVHPQMKSPMTAHPMSQWMPPKCYFPRNFQAIYSLNWYGIQILQRLSDHTPDRWIDCR